MKLEKHILSIYVRNKPGVMSQVSGLFTRRGYNIDSIAVGVTENADQSVITIILRGSNEDLLQFKGQLLKLSDVIDATELPYHESLLRELLLIRVKATAKDREEIFGIVEVFGGRIAEINIDSILIESNGNSRRINSLIAMLKKFSIIKIARTGQVALAYSEPNNE